MLAGTARVTRLYRAALPFAQWADCVITLGFIGYNMWQLYKLYCEQVERDTRNGFSRTLNETIELIVRPDGGLVRRANDRNQIKNSSDINNQKTSNGATTEFCDMENIENCDQNVTATTSNGIQQSQSKETTNKPSDNSASDNEEVTVVYDSRLVETRVMDELHDQDEVLSTTTLESTDSNNGILRDIYTECFICARTLNDPIRPVATLPFCMHPFHQNCLDGVLKWHPKCPVCDFHIFSPI